MSWLSYCYKTYQNSVSEIGKQQPGKVPLLPVAHTTQQVNIEVELDKDGNFQYAGLLAQDQRTTIIPCTEESSARTSGMVPHPLVDTDMPLAMQMSLSARRAWIEIFLNRCAARPTKVALRKESMECFSF